MLEEGYNVYKEEQKVKLSQLLNNLETELEQNPELIDGIVEGSDTKLEQLAKELAHASWLGIDQADEYRLAEVIETIFKHSQDVELLSDLCRRSLDIIAKNFRSDRANELFDLMKHKVPNSGFLIKKVQEQHHLIELSY